MLQGGEKMGNGLPDEFHRDAAVFAPPRSLSISQFLQAQMAAPRSPRGRSLTGAAPRPWGAPRVLQSRDTAQLVLQRAGRRGTAVLYCRAVQFQPLSMSGNGHLNRNLGTGCAVPVSTSRHLSQDLTAAFPRAERVVVK